MCDIAVQFITATIPLCIISAVPTRGHYHSVLYADLNVVLTIFYFGECHGQRSTSALLHRMLSSSLSIVSRQFRHDSFEVGTTSRRSISDERSRPHYILIASGDLSKSL